jgi:hypothetical protein
MPDSIKLGFLHAGVSLSNRSRVTQSLRTMICQLFGPVFPENFDVPQLCGRHCRLEVQPESWSGAWVAAALGSLHFSVVARSGGLRSSVFLKHVSVDVNKIGSVVLVQCCDRCESVGGDWKNSWKKVFVVVGGCRPLASRDEQVRQWTGEIYMFVHMGTSVGNSYSDSAHVNIWWHQLRTRIGLPQMSTYGDISW